MYSKRCKPDQMLDRYSLQTVFLLQLLHQQQQFAQLQAMEAQKNGTDPPPVPLTPEQTNQIVEFQSETAPAADEVKQPLVLNSIPGEVGENEDGSVNDNDESKIIVTIFMRAKSLLSEALQNVSFVNTVIWARLKVPVDLFKLLLIIDTAKM